MPNHAPQPSKFSENLAALLEKRSAYDSSQVSGFYETGGAGESLRRFGTIGGAALGGAAGLAASIKARADESGSLGSKLMGLFGQKQPGIDLKQDLGAGALGAVIGGLGGHFAGALAERAAKSKNLRYAKAEEMTGVPRSKLEELPMLTRLHLLGSADKELRRGQRRKKTAGLGGPIPDSEILMIAAALEAARRAGKKLKGEKPEPEEKKAADYSASQLREYQLKHLEPGMGALADIIGSTGGALLGYAGGSALGDSPVYRFGGAAAGAMGGVLAARHARRIASEEIKRRYLTRRVLEEAGGAPVSAQLQAMRTSPVPTLQTEKLVTQIPSGHALKLAPRGGVEGMP